jgi:hypothetical protein
MWRVRGRRRSAWGGGINGDIVEDKAQIVAARVLERRVPAVVVWKVRLRLVRPALEARVIS